MSKDSQAFAQEFAPGTVLFRERDPADRMYVIRSGRVKIYRTVGNQELVLAFLGAGDFLGEMALLEGLPRSASAVVVEPSILIEVDSATFESMIRRNIEIAVRMLRKLASRVRALDGRLEKLLAADGQVRILEVLRWLIPQGVLDGDWMRVPGIVPHLDLAAQAAIPATQAADLIDRLEKAGCMKVDGEDLLIADKRILDSYAAYLEMRRQYDPITSSEDDPAPKVDPSRSIRRLLTALHADPDQIEAQQRKLMEKYERYLELKTRFKGIDDA